MLGAGIIIAGHLVNLKDPVLTFSLGSSPFNSVTNYTRSSFQGAAYTPAVSELSVEGEEVVCELPHSEAFSHSERYARFKY